MGGVLYRTKTPASTGQMFNTILLKKSAVKDRVPAPEALEYGELAIGFHHSWPALFLKDNRDAVRMIAPPSSTKIRGLAEIATRTEALDGKDNERYITPKRLKQWGQINVPDWIFDSGGADGLTSIDNGTAEMPPEAFINVLDSGGAEIEPLDTEEDD